MTKKKQKTAQFILTLNSGEKIRCHDLNGVYVSVNAPLRSFDAKDFVMKEIAPPEIKRQPLGTVGIRKYR